MIQRFLSVTVLSAAVLAAGAAAVPQAAHAADPAAGTCTGRPLSATPPAGSRVAPGQRVTFHLDVDVTGGDALGCARDLRISPWLRFVSATPGGEYWPEATGGPIAGVTFAGPIPAGTALHGTVVLRLRRDVPRGLVITTTSGDTVTHVAGG